MKATNFKLEITNDYSPMVLKHMKTQVQKGLIAIGAEAEGYAKADCPVDTGRLRNSITYATSTFHSSNSGEPATASDSATHTKPDENAVYLGSNVEYASYIEYGSKPHKTGKSHFIKDAIANHSDHYKAIMKSALES